LGIIYLLVEYTGGPLQILLHLQGVSPFWLLLGLLTFALSILLRIFRWGLLLEAMEYQGGMGGLLDIYMVSLFLSYISPGRLGDVARPVLVRQKSRYSFGKGFTSVVVERIFDFLAMLFTLLLALAYLPRAVLASGWVFKGFITLALLASSTALCLVLFYRYERRLANLLVSLSYLFEKEVFTNLITRSHRFLKDFNDGLRSMAMTLRSFLFFLSLSILSWIFELVTSYLIFHAFGYRTEIPLFVLAISLGIIFSTFPLLPGGLGAYELGVTGVLALGNIGASQALAFSLADHLLRYLFILLVGGLATVPLWREIARIGVEGRNGN
jgi:hypothetical protein